MWIGLCIFIIFDFFSTMALDRYEIFNVKSIYFLFKYFTTTLKILLAMERQRLHSFERRRWGKKRDARNQGRHPITPIMYYLSAANVFQKSSPTILCIFYIYLLIFVCFFFLFYSFFWRGFSLLGARMRYVSWTRECWDSGFLSPRSLRTKILRQLRHIHAGFFLSFPSRPM